MGTLFNEQDTNIIGGGGIPMAYGYGGGFGGGGGGFGSCFAGIILVVVVLWLLFRTDRNDGHGNGHGNGHGDGVNIGNTLGIGAYPFLAGAYGGNCNYDCKPKMVMDMSNCEVDKDLWKVDADVWKSACETQKVVVAGDQAILDKLCAQENQNLRDKLAESYAEKAALKSEFYTEKKFSGLEGLIYKMDNQNDKNIACLAGAIKELSCELPKRPPVWCEGITPNTHHTDCHDFPRRSKFRNDDCDCAC